jgi:phage terminase large subunit-like protein
VIETDLDRFAGFCEQHLRLENGRPLVLEPFQRRILADYFAGTTETLVLVSKKNGKSTLLAALALWHITAQRDAECVIAAAARDQAQIMLRQAGGFIRRSEALRKRLRVTQREVVSLVDGGRIRCLASDVDTADGVIVTLALVDELHRHKSADLYGVLRDGLGPRGGQLITISTAGDDEGSPLGKMRSAALALPGLHRDGAYRYARSHDGGFVMHEWSLDASDDLDDLELVATANPASWQDVAALRRRRESPTMTSWQWARFACGVWVQGENTAVSPVEWGAAAVPGASIPDGESVSLGVDLGWRWDTTAVAPVWRTPEDKLRLGAPTILVPPRDGTSIDVDAVFGPIEDACERWDVQRVVLDPSCWTRPRTASISRNASSVSLASTWWRIRSARSRCRWRRNDSRRRCAPARSSTQPTRA